MTEAVTLEELLHRREVRAALQREALATFRRPVLSLTIVQPGPVKLTERTRWLLAEAHHVLKAALASRGWRILFERSLEARTGCEALKVIEAPAEALKRLMVELEDTHPLGRLWDLDVVVEDGPKSRGSMGLPPRACLVCGQAAHACTRAQVHALSDLERAIEELVHAHGLCAR